MNLLTGTKLLVFTIAFCSLFSSCQKETTAPTAIETPISPASNTAPISIEVKDGMLSFKSESDLYQTINKLASMSMQDRMQWGAEKQIKTLQMISDEIAIDQDAFETIYYQDIEEGLSIEALQATGKTVAFCDTYKKYLDQGIITEVIEEDGFYSYHLSLLSPSIVFVANEQGAYLVDGSLYLHTNDFLAIKKYEGQDDIALLKVADRLEREDIIFFDFQNNERIVNYFYKDNIFGTHGTLTDPTWYYDDANRRFKHYVEFRSTVSASLLDMNNRFYTEARAERKRFFQWKARSSYLPIEYINGQWSYSWYRKNWDTGLVQSFSNNLPGGVHYSPFIFNPPGTTNLLGTTLNPYGYIPMSSPYRFDSTVLMDDMLIHGYFLGYTGTYHTNYTE